MPFMIWDDKYSVGIEQFDQQHKKLIELINRLHEAMKSGQGYKILGDILVELVQYTAAHFAAEEKLLIEYNYPEFLSHKVEHEKLTSRVIEIQTQLQDHQTTLTLAVMKFLQDWLLNHIQGTDKKYTTFLKARGIQ